MTGIIPPRLALRMTVVRGITILNPPPMAQVGVAYSHTFQVFGGTAPYTFEQIGTLPAGWSFNAVTGTISAASPAATDVVTLTVYVRDSTWDYELTQTFPITIARVPVTIAGHAPTAHAGIAYSYSYATAGGVGAKTCALVSGTLPAGITLSTSGTLSGTPTLGAVGTYTFTVKAIDTQGTGAQITDTLTVDVLAVTVSGHAPNGITQADYYFAYSASGGIAPYTYSYTGTLPTGITLSSAGVLSNYPLAEGAFTFTIVATDSIGTVGTLPDSITVTDPCGDYHLGSPSAIAESMIFHSNPTLPIAEHLCNEVKP